MQEFGKLSGHDAFYSNADTRDRVKFAPIGEYLEVPPRKKLKITVTLQLIW